MITQIIGHPGTGKTTTLTEEIEAAVRLYGSNNVVVGSFTNAAARELISRNLVLDNKMIGTLHSHAYRAIGGNKEIADLKIKEWNDEYPMLAMSGGGNIDADGVTVGGRTDADTAYAQLQVFRNQMLSRDLWRGIEGGANALLFERKWNEFKQRHDYIDFTDMIEIALRDVECHPENPIVAIYDEFQDFTRLEIGLVEKWMNAMPAGIIIAGDPNQCHPAHSLVKTTRGDVRIDELDPNVHRLISYDRIGGAEIRRGMGCEKGIGAGYEFKIAHRPFAGYLHNINGMECTDNHKIMCKWSNNSKFAYCVYLMRKGTMWRIGRAQVSYNRSTGEFFGLGLRARNEGADAAWILKIVDTERDAARLELFCNLAYRLPMFLFHYDGASREMKLALSTKDADELQDTFRETINKGALKCLRDFGRLLEYPIWDKSVPGKGMGSKAHFVIQACNFMPGYMSIPTYTDGLKPAWNHEYEYKRTWYEGNVYSLEVDKYKMYFCNEVLVLNSIYSFKGANPNYMIDLTELLDDKHQRTLTQSYRVPLIPQQYASGWIKRATRYIPADYTPKVGEPGFVRNASNLMCNDPATVIRDMDKYLRDGKNVMIQASCSYMIDGIKAELRKAAIPFHNPYRRERTDWNPLYPNKGISSAQRIMAFTRPSVAIHGEFAHMWTWQDVWTFADVMAATGNIKRGAKKDIEANKDRTDEAELHQMLAIFEPEAMNHIFNYDVGWYVDNVQKSRKEAMDYPHRVLEKYGSDGLVHKPQVMIGTYHSFKGTQSDIVYAFPDLSMRTINEMSVSNPSRDAVIRMLYVGMTRCSEGLVLCGSSNRGSMDFPTAVTRKHEGL